VIIVSNFGDLAVAAIDNPGVWTQEEFTESLDPGDAERIYTTLEDFGYTVVPEGTALAAVRRGRPIPVCPRRPGGHLVDSVLRLPLILARGVSPPRVARDLSTATGVSSWVRLLTRWCDASKRTGGPEPR
jgi:hypothetical protein